MTQRSDRTVTVEGTTELLPFEADAPSSDAWVRALSHAAARGRALAAALGVELGLVLSVEEQPGRAGTPELRLAVTYALGMSEVGSTSGTNEEGAGEGDDVLDYVEVMVRPAYAAFRQQLLELYPTLKSSPAPIRNGKRRYEGFNRGGRNVIYAGFRRDSVRLQFELPDGHGAPSEDVIRHGRRDFRVVRLTSATQVGGAIELAKETLETIAY